MDSQYYVVLCIWCNLKGLLVIVFSVFSRIELIDELFIETCDGQIKSKFYRWPLMNQMWFNILFCSFKMFNIVGTCYLVFSYIET